MIYIAILIIIGAAIISGSKKHNKPIYTKKVCPPHAWYWEETLDENGEVLGGRMMCKNCGPFSEIFDK